MHDPVCSDDGDLSAALYGSFLPIPSNDLFPLDTEEAYSMQQAPGAIVCRKEPIVLTEGRQRIKIKVGPSVFSLRTGAVMLRGALMWMVII